ncbi:Ig-like domain-containing protein [Porphyromonas vaginalis]|uniref:Ig-like domain-containing protein n=1 Tax=Porphyromonas vaginalis TaxID=3044325 RepID=UPI00262F74BB|nr:Ig-like domain-containing protein [Porphyromonas vaginalis]
MTKKIFLALAALTALTLCFSSCKKDNTSGNKPKPKTEVKLKVEPKDVKVMVGKTQELTVTVQPADTKYTFESANADIATVSDKGVVTGVKAGKTVITVKAGDATKTANVEVIDASSMDTNSGIGSKDQDIPHFIYVPSDKANFTKNNLEVFKMVMTAAGWEWDQESYDYKDNKDFMFPFQSPMVDTKDGKAPKYFFHGVRYIHTPPSGNPWISPFVLWVYEKDPLAPELRADAEKDGGVVYLLKNLYGFDTKADYEKGKNAWMGFNVKAIKDVPLGVYVYSKQLKKEDLAPSDQKFVGYYSLRFELAYANVGDKSKVATIFKNAEARDFDLSFAKGQLKAVKN